jgi:hypothetical protein
MQEGKKSQKGEMNHYRKWFATSATIVGCIAEDPMSLGLDWIGLANQ